MKLIYLAIFFFFFSIYVLVAPGHLFTVDSVEIYRTAESIVRDGDLMIKRPYPLTGVDTEHFYSKYGMGQVILAIPLYLLGEGVVRFLGEPWTNIFYRQYPEGFGGDVHIFFVSLLNAGVTPMICIVLFRLTCLLGFRPKTALILIFIYGLSTLAFVHTRDFFQHPLKTLMLLFAFDALLRFQMTKKVNFATLAGIALGYGLLTRPLSVIAWPLYAIVFGFALLHLHGFKKRLWAAVAILWPMFLSVLIQLWFNDVRYGSPWRLGYFSMDDYPGFSTPFWVGLYGNLFSVGRSIFLYSPPLIASAVVYPRFIRKFPLTAGFSLAFFTLFLTFYSTWHIWDGGWCFGPRYFLQSLPFLLLPLALLIEEGSIIEKGFLLLCVISGIFVQLLGSLVDYNPIFWKWGGMNLNPMNAYLYDPALSPLAEHGRALLAGKFLDLWILDRNQVFGTHFSMIALFCASTVAIFSFQFLWYKIKHWPITIV